MSATDHVAIPGPRAVEAILRRSPARVRLLMYAGARRGPRARVLELAEARGITIERTTEGELQKWVGALRTQGVVALATPAGYALWGDLLDHPDALIIAVDQLTDPGNLGALIRSAEALGATGALVTRHRCARLGPAVSRRSAGASEILPIALETNLTQALQAARERGLQVVGAAMDGSMPDAVDWRRPSILVVGAEGTGLRRLTRKHCDQLVGIPLVGKTESLNAAVAGAILCYSAQMVRRMPISS